MDNWGKGKPRRRTSAANWKNPLQWNRHGWICDTCGKFHTGNTGCQSAIGHRPRVFCSSLADWLDEEVPIEWLRDLLELIRQTPNLDWLLLTKRPENWRSRLNSVVLHENPNIDLVTNASRFETRQFVRKWIEDETFPENVWIGASIENQQYADKRIPELLKIPAKVRFLSCEPLLGPVDIHTVRETERSAYYDRPLEGRRATNGGDYFDPNMPRIHWVIAGGESGDNRRELNLGWMRSLRDQCQTAGVPFFAKQDSHRLPAQRGRIPNDLWIQEFPK